MVTEHLVKKTLRRLARQRVVLILQPGNAWVIERAVSEFENEDIVSALRTCELRGWVTPVENAIPEYGVGDNGDLSKQPQGIAPIYRLTEGGWSVINRSHAWVISTFIIAAATLIVTIVTLYLSLRGG